MKEVEKKTKEQATLRCSCGNKSRFEANSKNKTIVCLDCYKESKAEDNLDRQITIKNEDG